MNSKRNTPNPKRTLHVVSSYETMTDEELIIACKRKDQVALTHLLKRYEHIITNMFYRRAPDWKDTSDLVQEVMIRIWKSMDQLRNPYSFKSWLNRIVNNIFYDELRRRPRGFQLVSLDEPVGPDGESNKHSLDIVDTSKEPESVALEHELAEVLVKAMDSIPSRFRQAAILRDVEGLSYEDIAARTDTELGTVKSRIARARAKLQKHITVYLKNAA